MKTSNSGFTLIELMIVVAIIGILAAIAVPRYQDYVVRSQMKRVVFELAGYKSAIELNINQGRGVANSDIGFVPSNLTTATVAVDIASFNPDGSGRLEVTVGRDAHSSMHGLVVAFNRTDAGQWRCQLDVSSVTANWDVSYLPDGCSA